MKTAKALRDRDGRHHGRAAYAARPGGRCRPGGVAVGHRERSQRGGGPGRPHASPSSSPAAPSRRAGTSAAVKKSAARILAEALALGAEYVDLEWNGSCADLIAQTGGRRIVLSHHDFDGMPADVHDKAQAMLASGAEVVKLAVTAASPRRLPHAARDWAADPRADGPDRDGRRRHRHAGAGQLVGLVLDLRGHAAGVDVAPGQIDFAAHASTSSGSARIGAAHRHLRRRRQARDALGVTGDAQRRLPRRQPRRRVPPPGGTPTSPTSLPLPKPLNLAGASVTAPFKVPAFEQADECDPVSRRIQSVNTLRRVGSRWLGCNTDVAGFLSPLESAMRLQGKRARRCSAPVAPPDRWRWPWRPPASEGNPVRAPARAGRRRLPR